MLFVLVCSLIGLCFYVCLFTDLLAFVALVWCLFVLVMGRAPPRFMVLLFRVFVFACLLACASLFYYVVCFPLCLLFVCSSVFCSFTLIIGRALPRRLLLFPMCFFAALPAVFFF